MATLEDLGVSAFINIVSAFAFLLLFAVLRIQPINDRVYFPKWYIAGERRGSRSRSSAGVGKFVNLNIWTYITFLNWMPAALRMSQAELIQHAGLDSAVYLRIYTLGAMSKKKKLVDAINAALIPSAADPTCRRHRPSSLPSTPVPSRRPPIHLAAGNPQPSSFVCRSSFRRHRRRCLLCAPTDAAAETSGLRSLSPPSTDSLPTQPFVNPEFYCRISPCRP